MLRVDSPATLEHGMVMMPLVRSASYHGDSPMAVLRVALETSARSWALMLGDRPLVIYGLAAQSFFSDVGYLWALLSEDVSKHKVLFAAYSKRTVNQLRKEFRQLVTTTHFGQPDAEKWVLWLGFRKIEFDSQNLQRYVLEGA